MSSRRGCDYIEYASCNKTTKEPEFFFSCSLSSNISKLFALGFRNTKNKFLSTELNSHTSYVAKSNIEMEHVPETGTHFRVGILYNLF